MRKLVLFLLSVLALITASANEIVVVGDQFNRHYELNAKGEFSGLSVDVLRAIAKKNGDTLVFRLYPFARAQALVEHGKADIICGMYKTSEREKKFLFAATPYYQDQIRFYVRNGSNITWNGDLSTVRGKHVGIVRSWYYGPKFERAKDSMELSISDNLADAVKMLSRGMIDLLPSNTRNIETFLDSANPDSNIIALDPPIEFQNGFFAFHNDAAGQELRDKYSRLQNEMIANGEMDKLLRAHKMMPPTRLPGTSGK
jgi:polar amino acid transport system substrate-binding protein